MSLQRSASFRLSKIENIYIPLQSALVFRLLFTIKKSDYERDYRLRGLRIFHCAKTGGRELQ